MNISAHFEKELDLTAEDALKTWEIPGLAITVVKDDQVVLAKGYGVRQIGKPDRVDEHTLFAIASNTKAYTATAVGLLVQERQIAWDDPVSRYLPFFRLHDPHASEMITVRDLLCHRSGLGTWAGDMLQLSSYSTEEVMRRVRHIEPAFPFRAGYGYSNLMFIAAGMVIEAVSGLSWDEFIRQRLFEPMGFRDSVTGPRFFGERTNIAAPHEVIEGKVQPVIYRDDAGFGAAGSICASVADSARWLRLQLADGCLDGNQIVEASAIQETHTPHTIIPMLPAERKLYPTRHFSAYGLGWFMNDHDGRLLIRHTGGLDGMLSSTLLLPEEKLGVVVLTNKLPNMAYLALSYYLIDRLMGTQGQDWFQTFRDYETETREKLDEGKQRMLAARATGTQPSLPLKAFAGEYDAAIIGGATIREQDGSLQIQLKAHPSLSGALSHWHYDTFMCKWDDPILGESLVPFISDGQGHVAEFKVKIREDWIDPVEHVFRKI